MTPALNRATGGLRWLDRHWWVVVVAAFVGSEIGLTVWEHLSSDPILLARADTVDRGDIYSSLSTSSGAILGFTVAAVAILVTFAPSVPSAREANLEAARRRLVQVLLTTATFLGLALALSTVALGVDRGSAGHEWIEHLTLASAAASAIGLAVGGLGFSLAVLERANSQVR